MVKGVGGGHVLFMYTVEDVALCFNLTVVVCVCVHVCVHV